MSDFHYNQAVRDKRDGQLYRVVEEKTCGIVVCAQEKKDIMITNRIRKEFLELVVSK